MSKNNNENKYCWHYTTGEKFKAIVDSGYIYEDNKVTSVHIQGMVGAVWFTTRQDWEPTANKAIVYHDGSMRSLSKKETCTHGGGLVRFGVSKDMGSLKSWHQWKLQCSCNKKILKKMGRHARRQGSDTSTYRAFFGDLPREMWEAIDVYEDGKWVRVHTQDNEASALAA